MITFLNEFVMWWHWIVMGIILLIIEMSIGTFFILGLGIAAILVGVMDVLFITTFNTELLVWIILSLLAIAAWFKWVKEPHKTDSGQSNYRLDTLGTVEAAIAPHSRGKVKFDTPVLGNTVWHATATTEIAKGARVKIVQINGHLIEVKPIH